jgi:hypothetical protein
MAAVVSQVLNQVPAGRPTRVGPAAKRARLLSRLGPAPSQAWRPSSAMRSSMPCATPRKPEYRPQPRWGLRARSCIESSSLRDLAGALPSYQLQP